MNIPFSPQLALQRVIEHREIFEEEMASLMRQIMHGEVSPTLIAAILIGLRVKKETIAEITGAARVMREMATPVPVSDRSHLLDIVGTGGDQSHTFNISTTSMFVAAAAGAMVAKHGGRSVSSRSGSADVLEALGVSINLNAEQVGQAIEQVGLGFMFAPNHHGAMKHAAPIRKELGVRTIFNILGPMTNPAAAPQQLVGVFHPDLVGILVRVLQRLGSQRAMVVYGQDGLDEISLMAPTLIGELNQGAVSEYRLCPEDVGLTTISAEEAASLRVSDAEASATLVTDVLTGKARSPAHEIVCLNAGASLYVSGVTDSVAAGVERAHVAIASGAAADKLAAYRSLSRRLSGLSN